MVSKRSLAALKMNNLFDSAFNAACAAPFEQTVQFRHPDSAELYDVVAIFDANQQEGKLGEAPSTSNVYSLEFDGNYIDTLGISAGNVFLINSKWYKCSKKPFVDASGWASVPLTLTT